MDRVTQNKKYMKLQFETNIWITFEIVIEITTYQFGIV